MPSHELTGLPEDPATIAALDARHVFHSWSAQALIDPLPIAGAQGSLLLGRPGQPLPRLSPASSSTSTSATSIRSSWRRSRSRPAGCARSRRSFANDARSEAARLIAELAPGDSNTVFFTNGGAEATENAMRMARLHTGRHKVLAAYRSYHGATGRRDHPDRRPAPLGQRAGTAGHRALLGALPVPLGVPRRARRRRSASGRSRISRDVIMVEGPHTIAAIILETVVGTNGILVPPPGYLAGVRAHVRRVRHRDDRRRGDGRASAGAASGSPSITGV